MKQFLLFTFYFLIFASLYAQEAKTFTHADTLRGSITPERAWWNVLRYDITVQPDYISTTTKGKNKITYKVISDSYPAFMQIDLQEPMIIDSVLFGNRKMNFTKEGNAWHVQAPKQKENSVASIDIYFHGKPREAKNPPWDGGWIWKKDDKGRPWMSVACQGLGASVWYPCKDHQSDEPDSGATLTMIVPDTLMAVGNGRMIDSSTANHLTTYTWQVKNPINNYNIIPYIGKYVNFSDTLHGEKGTLDLNYWVLDYELDSAKQQFTQVKPMLHCMEYWFSPYPFYEDGYKLVQSPHLGMEHQSAVGYGNHFLNGYLGLDLSQSGWGLKWDFIIEHESSHEWWGNNITSNDIADMWIHESFGNYSETLYTEWLFGKEAGTDYNVGTRLQINNDAPIISAYNVNSEGSGDMYYKGGNMLHTIRHVINDDTVFRSILRGLNKEFYHKTVTAKQVEDYFSEVSKIDLSKVFEQYLTTTQIPTLQYYFADNTNKIFYRWAKCVPGFNMPVTLVSGNESKRITPTEQWQQFSDTSLFNTRYISRNYFFILKQVPPAQ